LIGHREAGHVVWQLDPSGANVLALKQFSDVSHRCATKTKPLSLLGSDSLSLLDRLPPGAWRWKRIHGGGSALVVNSEKSLKVRDLTSDGHAIPQCVHDVRLLSDSCIGSKQGRQSIVFLKIVHDEFAQVTPVQAGESI
jgi:hypothetical protein